MGGEGGWPVVVFRALPVVKLEAEVVWEHLWCNQYYSAVIPGDIFRFTGVAAGAALNELCTVK